MALVLNKDFSCSGIPGSSEVCTPILSNAGVAYSALQNTLNRYSPVAQFAPLPVTGKLDRGTLAAAQKVGRWVINRGGDLANNPFVRNTAWATGLAQIAVDAETIVGIFHAAAEAHGLPLVKAPTSDRTWWIVTALAVVGGGTLGYALYRRQARRLLRP